MPQPRLVKRRIAWAKTLAVISCALALLAVQPAAQAATAKVRPAAAIGNSGAFTTASPLRTTASTLTIRMPANSVRAELPAFSSVRQLHILATVEILHRFLLSELRLPQQHILPLVWFEPVCMGLQPLATDATDHPIPQTALPPPVERTFAISRQLLAPPAA